MQLGELCAQVDACHDETAGIAQSHTGEHAAQELCTRLRPFLFAQLLCATAWAITWPITMANDASSCVTGSRPSYTTILPPGIQKAFCWFSANRLNSHWKLLTLSAKPFWVR